MQKAALYLSAFLVGLVAVAHLARYAGGVEVMVGGASLPIWISLPAGLILAALALWLLWLARRA